MVIVNAIHSILQHGEIQSPGLFSRLLVQGILIVAMSLAFLRWSSFRGAIISYVLIMLFVLPFSLWLFKAGVWLDFALPLLAVHSCIRLQNVPRKNRRGPCRRTPARIDRSWSAAPLWRRKMRIVKWQTVAFALIRLMHAGIGRQQSRLTDSQTPQERVVM